ncbi:hypothetical protein [Phenylobacterium sp.]|uniref:hypothetical protein n=1 Tax=Phenylobacterium sp. TaxID=1871053 RepID=UPI0035B48764
MIDVHNLDRIDRSPAGLEAWWLFCLTTGGASAERQAARFATLLSSLPNGATPFQRLRQAIRNGTLRQLLEASRLGKYDRLHRSYCESVEVLSARLAEVAVEDLESISGSGMKTARLFALYAREEAQHAVLDGHVLRRLAAAYPSASVPHTTPQRRAEYLRLEALALDLAQRQGLSPREFDMQVWRGAALGHLHEPRVVQLLADLSAWCVEAGETRRTDLLGERVLERRTLIDQLLSGYRPE